MMDNISGFQMAHKLKENPATAQIPIIFITALDGENHMVKGLNIGADDYIVKPLSMFSVSPISRTSQSRSLVSTKAARLQHLFSVSPISRTSQSRSLVSTKAARLQHLPNCSKP